VPIGIVCAALLWLALKPPVKPAEPAAA
jgi:hypothetical protein